MSLKSIFEEIQTDIEDIRGKTFEYKTTFDVPKLSDSELTWERGIAKKGKEIETCVLFVDIRNSVELTKKHYNITMGRVYTAFTKAVLKVARHHNGHIRNIIGDRVMVVFPSENCFTNAVECAISINHIAKEFLNIKFENVDFKCGIGIDFGKMRVIKVGIQRNNSDEKPENEGLVWVGDTANFASRLTDAANKTIKETYFEVIKQELELPLVLPSKILTGQNTIKNGMLSLENLQIPTTPHYINKTLKYSLEDFSNEIIFHNGSVEIRDKNIIRFEKKEKSIDYPAILITEKVFTEYKKANPNSNDITDGFWKKIEHNIKNISFDVFGGDIYRKI